MAALLLLRAVGRALLGRAAPLLGAERGISEGGGARWAPVRPGLPVPLSSPLAGLTRPIPIKEPPKRKPVDRWTKKRALFGVYDNVGILGETHARPHPVAGREGREAGTTCVLALPPAARGRAGFGAEQPPPEPGFISPFLFLGGFQIHPKDLIRGPIWLRGWKGDELQRCIRKKRMVGDRMFIEDLHKLNKRIRYLYRRFNRTGKHR
ncbi:39S ribosomal protein L51 [Willisornis vidua]|uniref:Large ribosomal subunit protein mL51 n=1 Tax=Willisornis vidua TaxID=1566151 RepID=A0ABQ9D799_9PASS|nr:39S ribosomal protein L51 [Willisornis vidua]